MAETDVEILNIDTSKSTKSIKDLRKEIKDLRDQLLNLDKGTKEYNDILVELADKTHDLKDAQEEIKRTTTDFGDRLSNIQGTITGVAGGFQAMIGTLSILGVNLGDDVKMLKLLQSAMAITQGVAAIDAGVKSFRALSISIKAASVAAGGFKKALIATGVGALVVGVGLLIANLDKLTRLFSGYADESKKFAQSNEQLKASIDALNESTDFEVELMKQDGATAVEIAKKRRDVANAALEEAKANYDLIASKKELHGEELEQLREAQKIEDEMRNRAWKAEQAVWLAERQARIDQKKDVEEAAKKRLETQRAAAQKAEEEKKREMANIAKIEREAEIGLMGDREGELAKLEDTYKEQLALYEKRGKDTTKLTEYYRQQVKEINDKYDLEDEEREIEMWESRSAAAVAGTEKMIAAEQEAYARMQIDTDNRLAADYSEEKVQEAEEMMERAYLALLDKKIELQKQLLENENLTADDYIAVQDNLLALQQERAEKSVAIEQKALEKRKKLNENYANAIRSITDSITSILGSVGETLEQGSEEWKAVMTTKAIISTIKGGVDAYMGMIEAIPGPAGIAAGALAAAATVTAGMAEVSKIQNTDISTSGSGGSTSTSTSLGSVNASAVQVAATQVTNTRQTPTTRDVEELPAQQVYVLEGDISRAQNNVRVTVEQATH